MLYRRLTLSLCAIALGTSLTHLKAQDYPSIVGEWYDVEHGKGDCGTQWSLNIGPKSMVGAETYCEFSDVRRDQWMVTWNGVCWSSDEEFPVRIVATENPQSGELSVAYSTGITNIHKSCDRR